MTPSLSAGARKPSKRRSPPRKASPSRKRSPKRSPKRRTPKRSPAKRTPRRSPAKRTPKRSPAKRTPKRPSRHILGADTPCGVARSEKKYRERPSPPYSAEACRGMVRVGNDGDRYVSAPASNGVHRWVRL